MNNRTKGIIAILLSAFGFALMNLFIPLAGDLPTIQKSFFRNLIAFLVAFALLLKSNKKEEVKELHDVKSIPWKTLILRASLGTAGIFCNYYALDHLFISDASVLNKLAPFATLILSWVFLKEDLRKEHIISILIAFVGVLFVVKPTLQIQEILPYLIGILGGICAGGAYTCVRKLNTLGVNSSFIVAFFSGFSCIVCIPFMIFNFVPMGTSSILALIGVGLAALIGQFGITLAYKFAPASEISVFDYSTIIFTGLFGFLFLHQIPDYLSIIGYILIFSGALINFMNNRRKQRMLINEKIARD